jgi:ribosome-binding protein aMBF1 (putative translation factor)
MSRKPNQHVKYRPVPELLREMRENAGLTQRALAAKIARPYWFVARSETGSRRLDVTEFVDWCVGCEISPKDGIDRLTL